MSVSIESAMAAAIMAMARSEPVSRLIYGFEFVLASHIEREPRW